MRTGFDASATTTGELRLSFRDLLPALRLGLAVAACHGIGRFAYALLLPTMREELGWTYLAASWMNTANAIGYVVGAITGFWLLRFVSASRLFIVGLVLTATTVALTGASALFPWLFLVRLLTGIGTAWTFSCGGAIVTQRFAGDARLRGYATGLFFGSSGIGMILTALVVPAVVQGKPQAWGTAWLLLGAVAGLLAAWPIRESTRKPGIYAEVQTAAVPLRGTCWPLASYFLFAVSHPVYIFFVFAWLRSENVGWTVSAAMWMTLGAVIFVSPFLWQGALNRWPGAVTVSASSMLTGLGALVPLVSLSPLTIIVSAVLVGSALFIVPSAMTVLARQQLPQQAWSRGIMFNTIVFAAGQALGSWASGAVADRLGLTATLAFGGAGCLLGAVVALLGRNSPACTHTTHKQSLRSSGIGHHQDDCPGQ